ncbi:MAG TPA: hypothetical protein VFH51_14475, partial [Myxococcota bacterium]|nr:hypothetical protein [Myxococcota bacterium]
AKGVMVGIVMGRTSEASAATHDEPPTVPGATVTATGTGAANITLVFPNDDYTATNPNNVTNADGVFLAVNKGTSVFPFQFNLEMSSAVGGRTWATQAAGMSANSALIFEYPADEPAP